MKKSIFFVFACIILIACDTLIEEPVSDDTFLLKNKSSSVENCENVRIQGVFEFGGPVFDFYGMTDLLEALKDAGAFDEHPKYGIPIAGFNGCMVYGGGALPIETTIAGVTGMLGSIVTHMYDANDNSAVFYHLFHFFKSNDGKDAFVTWDHAVQSPVNMKNYTAKINNKLELLAGNGIFENASGKLINNGMITFGADGPLKIHANVHGRICGDVIGKGY